MRPGLAFALIAASCASGPVPRPVVVRPTKVERVLLQALQHEDLAVRVEALRHLANWRGGREHVPAIEALAADEDPEMRGQALRALGLIARSDPSVAPLVLPLLKRSLHDPSPSCQRHAMYACIGVPCDDWSDLEGLLADASWRVRAIAARVLAWNGCRLHPDDVASVLHDIRGTDLERLAAVPLQQLVAPEQRDLAVAYLSSSDGPVAFRAAEAIERIDAIAAGAPADWKPPSQLDRERYQRENAAAEAALARREWMETEREDLLAAVRDARLVLFGEIHSPDGPLREAQKTVLRTMVAGGGHLVLGYEPSVQDAQQLVLDLAYELGVEVIPVEADDWRAMNEATRYAERDDDAALVINVRLALDPQCRMLVIRGESHVVPDGYLDRQLWQRPVFVLSVQVPPFEAMGDDSRLVDRVHRIAGDAVVFHWGVEDWFAGLPEPR